MKLLFDIFPVVLFFVAFKLYDIFVATAVAIVASFVQIGWMWFRQRKVDKMMWVSLAVITVFGGATLAARERNLHQMEADGALLAFRRRARRRARSRFKKNLVRSIMEHQVSLPETIWQRLLVSWIGFFAVMGALNLYVAYTSRPTHG